MSGSLLRCVVATAALLIAAPAFAGPGGKAAAPADPTANRCDLSLLGVGGELVGGIGLVDAKSRPGSGAKALEQARSEALRNATEQLRAKVCGALVDPRDCEAEMSRVLTPAERVYDARWACAVVGVEASSLGKNTAAGRAATALASLGQAVRAELAEATVTDAVALDVVRTAGGCTATSLQGVRQSVEAAIGAAGVAVLTSDAASTGAWSVSLEAAPRGKEIQIVARLVDPSGTRTLPVAPVAFPADAYGSPSLQDTCAATVKARAGTGGLTARLQMPTAVCAGQELRAELEVSQPSRVQVWSVMPDGSAVLLVPGVDADGSRVNGNWTGRRALPSGTAFPSGQPGDEMLVAVAVPASAPVGASAPSAFCRVPVFDASRIPAGAAVATQSWSVLDDPGRCTMAEQARAQLPAVQALIARAPICP